MSATSTSFTSQPERGAPMIPAFFSLFCYEIRKTRGPPVSKKYFMAQSTYAPKKQEKKKRDVLVGGEDGGTHGLSRSIALHNNTPKRNPQEAQNLLGNRRRSRNNQLH